MRRTRAREKSQKRSGVGVKRMPRAPVRTARAYGPILRGGTYYYYRGAVRSKAKAQRRAQYFRRQGYLARVERRMEVPLTPLGATKKRAMWAIFTSGRGK